MKFFTPLLCLALSAGSFTPCHADAFYTITDDGGPDPTLDFTYDSASGLIAPGQYIYGSTCANNGVAVSSCGFFTDGYTGLGFDAFETLPSIVPDQGLAFASGSLSNYGTYYSTGIYGSIAGAKLVVSQSPSLPSTAPTPEPASFLLLGSGLAFGLGILVRKSSR